MSCTYQIIDTFTEEQTQSWKNFIGIAIRDAERAHTGKGVWDIALSGCNDAEVSEILGEAAITDPACHFHLSRMSILYDITTNQPIASACGFHYPTCRVKTSQPAITAALLKLAPQRCSYPPEHAHQIWERIQFLSNSFPQDIEYDNTWMIDSVYTDPAFRGKGFAEAIVRHVLERGKRLGHKRSLITCGVGNEGARRVYERSGYCLVGQGKNSECQAAIGYEGFYVLEKVL